MQAPYSKALADSIEQQIEAAYDGHLSEEDRSEITLWQKGRALRQIVNFYGWEVVKEMLEDYATDAERRLSQTDPGDSKEVLTQHAVAYTTRRIYNVFIQDVLNAVEASARTPEIVREAARRLPTPAPIEE